MEFGALVRQTNKQEKKNHQLNPSHPKMCGQRYWTFPLMAYFVSTVGVERLKTL